MGMIEQDHDSKDEYEIIAIGSMGADFFRARGINPVFELRGLADNPSFEEVQKSFLSLLKCTRMNSLMSCMFVITTMSIV